MIDFQIPDPGDPGVFVPPVNTDLLYISQAHWYMLKLYHEAASNGLCIRQVLEADIEPLVTSTNTALAQFVSDIHESFDESGP